MSKTKVITALFDINRSNEGDGRSMDQYLDWFDKTLKLNTYFVVYTEEKYKKFVEERRDPKNTTIVIQDLKEIPLFKYKQRIDQIIFDEDYRKKIKDPSRIECNLGLYNVIQYSKFGWLLNQIKGGNKDDFYFWMDAGCSRFFSDFDLKQSWPKVDNLINEKFIIQGNINTNRFYPTLNVNDYIWDNNCILVGTLFGGQGKIVEKISKMALNFFEKEMLDVGIVNNEQIALGILYKNSPDDFHIHIELNNEHLPLFKSLAK